MKAASKGTGVPTLIGITITALAWCALFGWSFVTTIYSDHGELLERIRALKSENASLKDYNARTTAPSPVRKPEWRTDPNLQIQGIRQIDEHTISVQIGTLALSVVIPPPVHLRLLFDKEPMTFIDDITMKVEGNPAANPKWKASGRYVEISFDGPALNVTQILVLTIKARSPIQVLNVENFSYQVPHEISKSLKQRTLRLSNRIREFSEGQSNLWNSQPFNSYPNDPQVNEPLKIGRLDFNKKTSEYFTHNCDKELSEIIIEFKNDGAAVSVVSRLRALITAPILAEDKNAESPRWMLANEMVGALKELAGQIDESGKLVH